MCYINNYFFFLLCSVLLFTEEKVIRYQYQNPFWSRACTNGTQSPCDRAHHCNTLWMQTMPFCMRKHQSVSETCNSCRVREWVRVIVKVARLCRLFVNAFVYCLVRTILVRTKDDELLKRVPIYLSRSKFYFLLKVLMKYCYKQNSF